MSHFSFVSPRHGRTTTRPALASATLAAAAVVLSLLPLGAGLTAAPASAQASAPAAAQVSSAQRTASTLSKSRIASRTVGRLWTSIGRSPSMADVDRHAKRYDVFVLNAWDVPQMRRIRQLNPRAIVLVYKCLSSTRSYSSAAAQPAGMRYQDAASSWFARSSSGARIQWAPYPGHWQMAVWNASYQAAWAKNVTTEVVRNGWDGVMADNDMQTLQWYSNARFAGTSTRGQSDALLRQGLGQLVNRAGSSLNAYGKLLVPNVSDGRLDLGRWNSRARWGGGLEENFARWGTKRGEGYLTDWGKTGWVDQTRQLSAPLTLAITSAAPGDMQPLRYGFASAAVRAAGRVAWQPHVVTDYSRPERFAWQDVNLGSPGAAGRSKGVWFRSYSRAWVAVNPTEQAHRVRVPARFGGGTVRVPAKDAVLKTGRSAKHGSKVRVVGSRTIGNGDRTLVVKVRSRGSVRGRVVLRSHGRVVGTARVSARGKAKVRISRLSRGTSRVKVTFSGSGSARASSTVVKVRGR